MAHAELTPAAAGEAVSPRRRSPAASLEASLGIMVEIPAAALRAISSWRVKMSPMGLS